MTKDARPVHLRLIVLAVCLPLVLAVGAAVSEDSASPAAAGLGEFKFHHDGILGTSLDLTVVAPDAKAAGAVEAAVLAEIERLRKLISTYDPSSSISKLTPAAGEVKCPAEVLDVLEAYDRWNARTGGVFCGQLGDLIALWKQAGRDGKQPDPAKLSAVVRQIATPAWKVNRTAGTVTKLNGATLNVDALGKGYIIDKALQAARAKSAAVAGVLLAIGGDMRAWGNPPAGAGQAWLVGVADPKKPQDNAPPMAKIALADRAVCTSAHYERNYLIDGRKYSHILDPRTGQPVAGVLSATVVAKEAAVANALTTSLCVLDPAAGLKLVKSAGDAECLIVAADGTKYASDGWKALAVPDKGDKPAAAPAAAAGGWPKGYQVEIAVTVASNRKRPYVAFWVEDAAGKPVRMLQLWGGKSKYFSRLRTFWPLYGGQSNISAVTRATRPAGKYTLLWDGLDDKGKPVSPGTYTIRLETVRESGPNTNLKGKIACGAEKASATITGNSEIESATVTYGPTGK